MDFLFWLVTCIGQLGISAVCFNQLHATSWPRWIRKASESVIPGITLALLGAVLWRAVSIGKYGFHDVADSSLVARGYLYGCIVIGLYFISRWIYRKWRYRLPKVVLERQIKMIDVQKLLGQSVYRRKTGRLLGSIPFNQAHWVAQQSMVFSIEGLPQSLEGLRICHLSDFHLTGDIDKSYFEKMVGLVNELEPDFIFVTGDLIDEPECMDWVDDIFGKLSAKVGTYYVLGNHDRRLRDERLLRKTMADAGMISVNGQWVTETIGDATISIAGNELPWFKGADELEQIDQKAGVKILLSHSPDQVFWANRYGFDLMFAGHTHGGQIQIPLVGPIVAPSRHGILFASGSFLMGKMLMHVSRGISGDKCIRLNCPPELGVITLTGAPSR